MQNPFYTSSVERIPVAVFLEDALLRIGVLAALADDGRFEARDAWEAFEEKQVDRWLSQLSSNEVLITNFEAGIGLASASRRSGSAARILIITPHDSGSEIKRALELGVLGYALVGCRVEELTDGIVSVHMGIRHLGKAAAQRIADSLTYQKLTEREAEILRLMVQGMSNKMLANRLNIAVGTVKSHMKAIFEKLEATNRTQAAAEAQRRGLVGSSRAKRADQGFRFGLQGRIAGVHQGAAHF